MKTRTFAAVRFASVHRRYAHPVYAGTRNRARQNTVPGVVGTLDALAPRTRTVTRGPDTRLPKKVVSPSLPRADYTGCCLIGLREKPTLATRFSRSVEVIASINLGRLRFTASRANELSNWKCLRASVDFPDASDYILPSAGGVPHRTSRTDRFVHRS